MNFFEAQDSARRSTAMLVLLFLLAIAGLLILSNLIVFQLLYYLEFSTFFFTFEKFKQVFDQSTSFLISASILGFIALGSLYKLAQLSSGGASIALSLGGVIVPRSSDNPLHKKILNVVEEMAIASGAPVPQVYILKEAGINAFAAGWKTTNAVIGITEGALERLSRDELQGVIAHEFSHIFNGDMRLNIRLVAILHGILMIGMLGRMILRSMRHERSSRNSTKAQAVLVSKNIQPLLVIFGVGASLMIIGYTGTLFGSWIKSMISRQREFLADASAVQFTRNSEGIANALKKIGGAVPGSALLAASVDEYSHAYFASGDPRLSLFSFSTHPPLKQRILRIEPRWNGQYIVDKSEPVASERGQEDNTKQYKRALATSVVTGASVNLAMNDAMNAIDNIGAVSQQQIDAAVRWHQDLPDQVLAHAQNPYGAQALILALLFHKNPDFEQKQISVLNEKLGQSQANDVRKIRVQLGELAKTQTLPLIDLTLPTLKEMTLKQYQQFRNVAQDLISIDNKVDLREWIIQRVVLQQLDEHFSLRKKPKAKYFILGSAKQASEVILSMLAYLEHANQVDAKAAFDSAKRSIAAGALTIIEHSEITLATLNTAMDDLMLLKPPLKKRFLQACVHCIADDGTVTIKSYELTRAIASCLDCPMPPVLTDVTE